MPPFVLVTRPIDEAREFADIISAHGFEPIIAPLLAICPASPILTTVKIPDALMISSRQALIGVTVPPSWSAVPVYCVGDATRQSVLDAGFTHCLSGHGGMENLVSLIRQSVPTSSRLLYLCAEHIAHDPATMLADYKVERIMTYRAEVVEVLTPDVLDRFAQIHTITVFSARSGAALAEIILKNALEDRLKSINLLCLSPAVLESLRVFSWKYIAVAEKPTQDYMLDKLLMLKAA